MNFRIDRGSGEAAYRQLEHLIVSSIKEGVYREGMKIPSEVALAEKLGISRMTVNKALTSLARRGFLTRSPGRGSIVTPRKLHQGFFRVTSFNRTMAEMGMTPETRVLEAGIQPAGKAVAEALSINEGDSVVLVRRLRIADGIPLMLETRYLNHMLKVCFQIFTARISILLGFPLNAKPLILHDLTIFLKSSISNLNFKSEYPSTRSSYMVMYSAFLATSSKTFSSTYIMFCCSKFTIA